MCSVRWRRAEVIKEEEDSQLLGSLGINTLLNKSSLLGPLLFSEYSTS